MGETEIERLDELVTPMSFPWGLYCDPLKVLPENRYEVRVHGDGSYRIIERGESVESAVGKAVAQVEQAARLEAADV